MHFLKRGQKIRAWVDPPPLIRAMPERKRFFPLMSFLNDQYRVQVQLNTFSPIAPNPQLHINIINNDSLTNKMFVKVIARIPQLRLKRHFVFGELIKLITERFVSSQPTES